MIFFEKLFFFFDKLAKKGGGAIGRFFYQRIQNLKKKLGVGMGGEGWG